MEIAWTARPSGGLRSRSGGYVSLMVKIPLVATYRLQLTPTFGLSEAADLVPYLAQLGISHVYTSPYLQAAAGSTHGYDIIDPTAVNVELGGEPALDRFHAALQRHHLGNVVDVVPNHLSVDLSVDTSLGSSLNEFWWDVLQHGETSPWARFFDIDWSPPDPKLSGKVLLAVLGASYAEELGAGRLTLARGKHGLEVRYGDQRFPIDPASVTDVESSSIERFDDQNLMHDLLERQHYRLASWRVGRDELNYRRFFDINSLAGVRVEDEFVFHTLHRRILDWFSAGRIQGLRIDHPDGLRDPSGYLHRLRALAPDAWIVVEKILEAGESLPDDWPVDGTTGYDFNRILTGLFVPQASAAAISDTFEEFTGEQSSYEEVLRQCTTHAVRELLATEVTRLTTIAAEIFERDVAGRDVSRRTLQAVIEAVLVAMPVYRTYVVDGVASGVDRAVIAQAIAEAKQSEPTIDEAVFDHLAQIWSGDRDLRMADLALDALVTEFIARLQQVSGPAMAKGAEDTAFYRYNRLVSLNEVGSNPGQFGIGVDEFHAAMINASKRHPIGMVSTSTHDTKRSEDVRARISLLGEIPHQWRTAAMGWRSHNLSKWDTTEPDHNIEFLIYQTLVGSRSISADRLAAFAIKALREAKQRSSWIRPDTEHEAAVSRFIHSLDADPQFQAMLADFLAPLSRPGRIASLAQTLIKATAPGIPDFYQGSELWTNELVDPDNRVPVDFELRRCLAASIAPEPCESPVKRVLDDDTHGVNKLALIRTALGARRRQPAAFVGSTSTYMPVELLAGRADSAVAFLRGDSVLSIAPIRPVALDRHGWGDAAVVLPPGRWTNLIEGTTGWSGTVALDALTTDLPMALLERQAEA